MKITLPNRPYAGTQGESCLSMSNIPAADPSCSVGIFPALVPPAYMFGHEIGLLACSFQRDRDLHRGSASPEKLGSETASLLPRKKNKKTKPRSFGQKTSAAASHVSVRTENLIQKPCQDPSKAPRRLMEVA